MSFRPVLFLLAVSAVVFSCAVAPAALPEGILINHEDTTLSDLPLAAILKARNCLHVAYGHTSHGSQVTDGMSALPAFIEGGGLGLSYPGGAFRWTEGPAESALDLDDYFVSGDLGNPDRTTWATRTRTYLDDANHADVNVVMWSWCGQADTSAANIDLYLGLMTDLEADYPDVTFVYMTGHVNGCSTTGDLFLRNQQIRDYCVANNKVLYDFADIESYDPDGNYYGDKLVTDACDYDGDGDGVRESNWALDWQETHKKGIDWYSCSCAHSQSLNGNRKAYAAWSLWTAIQAMREPQPGDANYDAAVDDLDASILAANWQRTGDATWATGDFNDDGSVDDLDASILAANWQAGANAVAVPEPAGWALVVAAAMLWPLARRGGRRREEGMGER